MPPDASAELTEAGSALARRLLAETREDVAKADGKAQILLAAALVVAGVILGGIIAGDWQPKTLPIGAEVIWWVGVVVAGFGLGALGDAVRPRTGTPAPDRLTYFEEVVRHTECASLVRDLNTEAERDDRDAEQLLRLSKIAHAKYRSIKLAISTLGSGALLCLLGSVVG